MKKNIKSYPFSVTDERVYFLQDDEYVVEYSYVTVSGLKKHPLIFNGNERRKSYFT
jgi:hypothetical protein